MIVKRASRGFAAAALLVAAGLAGCGGGGEAAGEGVAVTGKITFDDEPVEEGVVSLVPIAGDAGVVMAEIKDGVFKTSREAGPSPGKYRVEVKVFASSSNPAAAKAKAKAESDAKSMLFGEDPAKLGVSADSMTPRLNVAPERYNVRSELTADIPAADSCELKYSLSK